MGAGIEARDFTAGGETTPEVRIVAQKSQISVKGYILDTIVATSLACNCEELVTRPGPIKSECICYPPGLVFATFITEGVGLVYANNVEDPMITLFETLIRATRDRGLDYYRSMGGFLAIMSLVGTAMPRREPDSAQPSDSTTLNDGDPDIEAKPFFELPNFLKKRDGQRPYSFEFLQDIRLIRGARFGVTSKNLLSLVPSNTRVGDKVFVMSGGGVPMVLRESLENEEGEKCYKLVGEAYVRGIMYGEGIGIDTSAEHIILV
ncbi:hypothetical protein GQ53DRAFT_106127 [Thozetella sp. PMI_491]|nr:hypothetical protein GQ53DRAFT_106127 [Thozetella sp. PMI_491]